MLCLVVWFKQKTSYEIRISDWKSDVFSSDLRRDRGLEPRQRGGADLWRPVRGLCCRTDRFESQRRQHRSAFPLGRNWGPPSRIAPNPTAAEADGLTVAHLWLSKRALLHFGRQQIQDLFRSRRFSHHGKGDPRDRKSVV